MSVKTHTKLKYCLFIKSFPISTTIDLDKLLTHIERNGIYHYDDQYDTNMQIKNLTTFHFLIYSRKIILFAIFILENT